MTERDNVYAPLSLVAHLPEPLLADYTKSVKEIFRHAARCLMTNNQVFNILSAVNSDAEERLSTDGDWPS